MSVSSSFSSPLKPQNSGYFDLTALTTHAGITRRLPFPRRPWAIQVYRLYAGRRRDLLQTESKQTARLLEQRLWVAVSFIDLTCRKKKNIPSRVSKFFVSGHANFEDRLVQADCVEIFVQRHTTQRSRKVSKCKTFLAAQATRFLERIAAMLSPAPVQVSHSPLAIGVWKHTRAFFLAERTRVVVFLCWAWPFQSVWTDRVFSPLPEHV